MLGFLGKWASSKGMVRVPNLSNLTKEEAISAIENAGLRHTGNSSTSTQNINLNNRVAVQSLNADDLVEYESEISFIHYNYVEVTTTTTTTQGGGSGGVTNPTPSPTQETTGGGGKVCNGNCESYTTEQPVCNGEDLYVGIFTGTRKLCSDGTYEICTSPTLTSYGACISTNVSSCGGSGGSGSSCTTSPTPTSTTCAPKVSSYSEYRASCGGVATIWVDSCGNETVECQGTSATTESTGTTTEAPTSNTWYFCCNDGSGESVLASSVSQAVQLANNICGQYGSSLGGGVYSTPQSCNQTTQSTQSTAAPTQGTTATTTCAPNVSSYTEYRASCGGTATIQVDSCGNETVVCQQATQATTQATQATTQATQATTQQNCTPVYSYTEYRAACGSSVAIYVNPCTGAESYNCPSATTQATQATTQATQATTTTTSSGCVSYADFSCGWDYSGTYDCQGNCVGVNPQTTQGNTAMSTPGTTAETTAATTAAPAGCGYCPSDAGCFCWEGDCYC